MQYRYVDNDLLATLNSPKYKINMGPKNCKYDLSNLSIANNSFNATISKTLANNFMIINNPVVIKKCSVYLL